MSRPARRGRGRPPGPTGKARDGKPLYVRLTAEQRAMLEDRAAMSKLSPEDYVRWVVFGSPGG